MVNPTKETLKRLKKIKNGMVYWNTSDFFPVTARLGDSLNDVMIEIMDFLNENKDLDEEHPMFKWAVGRMIVKKSRESGVSSKQFKQELDNWFLIIFSPICIWYEDELGNLRYTLKSSLQA